MKSIAKSLIILGVLLTGSLALTGQKALLVKDIQPLMAFVSDIKYDVELSAEYNSNSYQFYMEDKLQLENWMIYSSQWEAAVNTKLAFTLSEEKEGELVMEDWMVEPFDPGKDMLSDLLKEEKELPIQFELWMVCCADWKIVRL